MSIQDWADKAREDIWRRNQADQDAIDILAAYLSGHLDTERAAQDITSVYETLIRTVMTDTHGPGLWSILCDAIRGLCGEEEIRLRLVALIEAIAKLPDVVDEHDNPIKDWGGVYWRDLPRWGMMFREYGIALDAQEDYEGEWHDQAPGYLNATAFAATSLSRWGGNVSMVGYAIDCLHKALEMDYDTLERQQDARMHMPAAEIWTQIAGKRLYQLCEENYRRKDGGKKHDFMLWDRFSGLSVERWSFWQGRFGEVSNMEGRLENSVRECAGRAADTMEVIARRS